MNCSKPGSSILHYIPEFVQTHIHWVSDAIQPSHPLLPPSSSCLRSFSASVSFSISWLFASGGQSTGVSASALPINIQGWLPLGSFATLWTIARQALLSVGFPRQEDWCGLLFPSTGDFPDPGSEPASPTLAGEFFTTEPAGRPFSLLVCCAQTLGRVWLFATLRTVAWLAPLSMGFSWQE